MSENQRKSDLNNLSASLHNIISGDTVNIPYIEDDDEDSTKMNKMDEKSSDSISSNESYPGRVNYNLGRRTPLVDRNGSNLKLQMYKNTTGNEASCESDASDDGHIASEKRDKPGPLASDMQRPIEASNLGVMRRNSISMPVLNESDLDALRNLHMKAVESSETMDSQDSLTKITVSCCLLADMFNERRYLRFMSYRARRSWYNCLLFLMTTSTSLDKIEIRKDY